MFQVLVYHVPDYLQQYQCLGKLSMERVENRNSTNKQAYFRATSKGTWAPVVQQVSKIN